MMVTTCIYTDKPQQEKPWAQSTVKKPGEEKYFISMPSRENDGVIFPGE
jgi:hypothetical protein